MQFSRRDLATSAVLAAIKNDEDARAAEAAIAALPIGTFSDEESQPDAHDGATTKSFRPLIDRIKRRLGFVLVVVGVVAAVMMILVSAEFALVVMY